MNRKILIRKTPLGKILPKMAVFATFLALSALVAMFFAPIVPSDAATNTATAGNTVYSASISADDTVSLNITPTATQQTFSAKNTITYTNTCPSGFTLSAATSGSSNALTRTGNDSLTKTIPSTSAGTTLANNSWGYTTSSGNTSYSPMPASGASPVALLNTSSADASAKTLDVTYAVKVDNSIPSGTYTNDIAYSVTVKPACMTYSVTWNYNSGTAKTGVTYPKTMTFGDKVNLSNLSPTR